MANVFGIINSSSNNIRVEGLQDHRPIGAFSFLGRYRVIDFPLSNMSNSDIDRIQVYIRENPRSLTEHIRGVGNYNINSKHGHIQVLFADSNSNNSIYNTDIAAFMENISLIEHRSEDYVVIAPSYMVFTQDFSELLDKHISSEADITLLYHKVSNAKETFLNCDTLNLNRQKGVESIERNRGTAKERNIFMDTYVMKRELFVDIIKKALKLSSVYTLTQIINLECAEMDVRGVPHRGYFASLTDFKSYFDANLELLDSDKSAELFQDPFDSKWPIYTSTTDACPSIYAAGCNVKHSYISNGCIVNGTVQDSIVGPRVTISKGAVVKNCVICANVFIGEGVHLENQVVDKFAKIIHVNEIVNPAEDPGYIRREDVL